MVGKLARWLSADAREARRRRREFTEVVTYPIGKLGDRMRGRIAGRVSPVEGELVAPISGRRCVYYDVAVIDFWPVIRERMGVPFLVEDGSGRALVDLDGARIALAEKRGLLAAAGPMNQRQEALFRRHYQMPARLPYRERIIAVDDWLEIIGAGTREPDPAATPSSYRGELPTRIVLGSSPQSILVVSDGT